MRRSLGIGLTAALCLPLLLIGSNGAVPGKSFAGRFDLKPASAGFGGFSALWIAPRGDRMIAVSDRGFAVTGRISRDDAGQIAGIALSAPIGLLGGDTQKAKPLALDSEGLAVAADGAIYISTEGPARVLRFEQLGGAGQKIGVPRDFAGLSRNGGLEGLAIAADGTLFTLPEITGQMSIPFPLFRRQGSTWSLFATIPRTDYFLPVSADFGPDGHLYLLFRGFGGLSGFATRLQRFELTEAGLGPAETLIESPFGLHGNLEGLSIWRDAKGQLMATMIADDNETFFQSSELVEYHLPD